MVTDERLRRALRGHAERVEPRDGSLGRIQQRVEHARRRRRQVRGLGTVTGAVAAIVLLVVGAASLSDGGGQLLETGPAATTSPPTPSTVPVPTSLSPPPLPEELAHGFSGIWPLHTLAQLEEHLEAGDTRYDDPAAVARAFAIDYLGMVDPVVGEPSGPGGHGTLEVTVQPRGEDGQPLASGVMETVVHLDPVGPPWQVLFTTSSNIRLEGHPYRNGVSSPLAVRGQATAYEGTVQVEVRQAGMEAGEALGREVVTAGSLGNLAPFATEVAFAPPTTEGYGALVLFTESAVDGSTMTATVVGLNFAGGGSTPATVTDAMEVSIFVHRGEELVPLTRSVPATTGVLRAVLEQLLVGPTEAERATGLSSWFSAGTAGLLHGVSLDAEGTAVVDVGDLPAMIPNASTSTGSERLLEQLDATVFQFPTVERVEYRLEGSCEAFWTWLQRSCEVVERPGG